MNTLNKNDNSGFYKRLLSIMIPVAIQNLITSSFTMVDTIMVGKLGELALASTGIATQIFNVEYMVIFGFCTGASTFYAQFWGNKDLKNIRKVLGLAWTFCAVIGLLFFSISILAPNQVLGLFSKDAQVIELAKGYLLIAAINFIFVGLAQPAVNCFRTTGQAKVPLYITLIAFATNTCLNYCLIFGKFGFPRMEIRGAALATVISRFIEFALTMAFMFRKNNPLCGPIREFFAYDMNFVKRVFANASTTTLNETMWSTGIAAQNAAFGRMGITEFASMKACGTVTDLFMMCCFSVGNAALILIGEQLGKGDFEMAKTVANRILKIGFFFSAFMAFLLFLLRIPCLSLFELTDLGRQYAATTLIITSCIIPINLHNGIQVTGIMRGGGDARFAAICEILTVWLIRVPLAFIGLWLGLPVYVVYFMTECESIFKAFILFARFKSNKWVKNMIHGM